MNIGLPTLFVSTLLVTGISVFASQNAYVAKPATLPKPASLFAVDGKNQPQQLGSDQRLAYSVTAAVATISRQTPSALPVPSMAAGALGEMPLPSFSDAGYSPPKAALGNMITNSPHSGAIESAAAAFAVSSRIAPRSEGTPASRVPTLSPVSNAIGIAKLVPPPGRSMTDMVPSQPSLTGNNKAYIDQISLRPVPAAVDQARGESLVYISQAGEFDFSQFEQYGQPQYAKVSETGSGNFAVEYGHDSSSSEAAATDGVATGAIPADSEEQPDNKKSQADPGAETGVSGR